MKIVDYLMIGATIRIGWEILCLPYAGFCIGNFMKKYSLKLALAYIYAYADR